MTKPKQTQLEKFKKAARDLETDDSEAHFNKKLSKIARANPSALRPKTGRNTKSPKRKG